MVKKIIIIVGIFGVGKSYQCGKWIEKHPEYKLINTKPDIDEMIKDIKEDGSDYWIGDYYLHLDPQASKLKSKLNCELDFWILFDKPETIISRQLISKAESPTNPKSCQLVWDIYMGGLIPLYDLKETSFFDGNMKEYTKDEFIEEFKSFYEPPSKEEVKAFLDEFDRLPEGYDRYYQHFNLPHGFRIGKDGYAMNEQTWAIIKDWIDWKGKSVLELCCFHGYFSQQIYLEGGRPTGMDRSPAALYTASIFAKWNNIAVNFYHYDIDDFVLSNDSSRTAIPSPGKFDIMLLFNVLHHLIHKDRLLRTMADHPISLFEINLSDKHLVQNYFNIIKEAKSPKANRIILMCKPK